MVYVRTDVVDDVAQVFTFCHMAVYVHATRCTCGARVCAISG